MDKKARHDRISYIDIERQTCDQWQNHILL
jgi:hypothetical protein